MVVGDNGAGDGEPDGIAVLGVRYAGLGVAAFYVGGIILRDGLQVGAAAEYHHIV